MISQSVPDQHKQAIAQLAAQIDHFLATGKRVQDIPAGKSGMVSLTAIGNHPKNLKARRDLHEPRVRELAANGNTASAIATSVGIDSRTVQRIAKEHGITLTAGN